MFMLFKKMYSQNDETGVLEALENKIFRCPTMVGRSLQNSVKLFLKDFTVQWWYLEKMSSKSQNFCFYHYQVFSNLGEEM